MEYWLVLNHILFGETFCSKKKTIIDPPLFRDANHAYLKKWIGSQTSNVTIQNSFDYDSITIQANFAFDSGFLLFVE